MLSSFENDRVNLVSVSDEADVSAHQEQTRLRQSEHTSSNPRQGPRLQDFEEGVTGEGTGDEVPPRGMLAQPNDPCPVTGSASSFVGNVQDPVPFDNNDTHAILEPVHDSFQYDNKNDDNEGDNNRPIFFRRHGQQLRHISDTDPIGPSSQFGSNSSDTFMNSNNSISPSSHLGRPTFPSPSFSSSSVHPLSPSAISLQTPFATTVDSYPTASFSSSSALPILGAMPGYPNPIGQSDPTPSQPNTPSFMPSQPRFPHHQHHSFQQQQELQERHPHTQHPQNDNHSSSETYLQPPTDSSRKSTSPTHHHLHQSSPIFPSTFSNSSPITSYPSHSQSSTIDYHHHHHHHPESATGHESTSFSPWANSRLSRHGSSDGDGHISVSSPQLSAQQQQHHHHQQHQGSRISLMDNDYSMSVHPLEQVTSSSANPSSASSPNRHSSSHLQQGLSSPSSHMTLPTLDIFEGTSSYSPRPLPAASHPLDNAQDRSNEGGVGTCLMTEGGQDLYETPRGRERRSLMAEGADRLDTWQPPFLSLPYTPDAPTNHTYISNPGETTLHMDMPDEGSNGSERLVARSGIEEEVREETDIERYSGLIMKSIAQSATRKIGSRSETSCLQGDLSRDLELGKRLSRSGTDLPPPSLTGHTGIPSSPLGTSGEHDDNGKATEDAKLEGIDAASGSNGTNSNPRLAAFSFTSQRLNSLMGRLFGSQHVSGSSNDVRNQSAGPSSSDGDRATGVSSSTGLGPRSTTAEQTLQHNEKMDETKSQQRTPKVQMSRPGGILSNLLKLQALSVPPPSSSRHRKRRRTRRRSSQQATVVAAAAAARRENFRKLSIGAELLSPSSSTSQILRTSRSASVISLPGLLMAAPSGAGFALPTMPAANEGGSEGGSLSPVVSTASSTAGPISAQGSLYLRSSPSVFAAATAAMGLQPPSNVERPLIGAAGRERKESTQYLQMTPQAHSTRSSISADDSTSMYSGISHNPQLEAMRLHQQAELAEVLADIMLRQDLLIRLCKSLIRYGAPSHRIELAMEAMCKTFGVDGSFAFLPGLMMISFGDSDTHTSETHLIKCAQGFDMGRLAKVNKIARAVVYGDLEPSEALMELKEINNEKPPYGMWVMFASFAVSSGLIAPLVFKGSWYDMLAGMGLGSVVGLTSLLASRYSVYSNVFEVSTSIVIAFVAKALRDYVCFTGVVLSGIVMLLPGLSLTTAIMELSSRYMISGSVRMFYSLIYCLFLGFGLSIGSNLWDVFKEPPPGDLKMGYCHPATEPWRWVLFPFLAISFNIQLYATPKQWPAMIVCSSVGYAVSEFAGLYWPHSLHIAAAVSAFVVGLLGNIYERLTHELAFVPILGAILLIVPGGMGVRSSLLLLDQTGNAAQGTVFALQMIIVALSIAVGLFASTLIVYPLGKKRNALLTF